MAGTTRSVYPHYWAIAYECTTPAQNEKLSVLFVLHSTMHREELLSVVTISSTITADMLYRAHVPTSPQEEFSI